jgi:hypothetical protein
MEIGVLDFERDMEARSSIHNFVDLHVNSNV